MDEYANPTLTTPFKDHPFKQHPDISGILKSHPVTKFGCTVCHAGQGMALSVEAAHGYTENWEKPLLKGNLMQASCAKCHGNFQTLKGAEAVAKGRKLMEDHGCFGCHSISGVGGVVSVDLKDIADKPLERIALYNFSLAKGPDGKPIPRRDWKLPAWIRAHLTQAPMDFLPNDPFAHFNKEPIAPSGMQDFSKELSIADGEDITAYLLSLSQEEIIPRTRFVPGLPTREPTFASAKEHGHFVFHKYGCAGCHGIDAKAGRRNFNALGAGQTHYADTMDEKTLFEQMKMGREPTLPDTVGTYTRDELIKKIQNGVAGSAINKYNPNGPTPPLYMPTWKEKIKGKELDDLVTWLMSIAKKQEVGF
jgi:mono/diheme cytochrome c family protein